MKDIIKIKCPTDGAVLSIVNQPNIETKTVTCPICKTKRPFSQYERVKDKPNTDDPPTGYPNGEKTNYSKTGAEETDVNLGMNFVIGKLRVMNTAISFQLKPGRNLIGRKANASSAQFQIPCTTNRMSREHLVIEVKKVPTKGFVHYASLYKEKVNPTYVENNLLEYGDKIVLKHKDVIKLPEVTLRFEIPDEEDTDL